jgi:hypothetical protein
MSDERQASGKFHLLIADAAEFAAFVGLIRPAKITAMFPVGTGGFQVVITSIEEFAGLVALLRHEELADSPPIQDEIAALRKGRVALNAAADPLNK